MEVNELPPRTSTKNRLYCAVNGCNSKSHVNLELSFHALPKPGSSFVYIETIDGKRKKIDRLKVWKQVLKRKEINPHMRVCSLHFKKSDFILSKLNVVSKKLHLKKCAVPSLYLPIFGISKQIQHQRQIKWSSEKECTGVMDIIKAQEEFFISADEKITSPPSTHTARKTAHNIRMDFDEAPIDVDKYDEETPTTSKVPRIKRIGIRKKQTDGRISNNPPKIDERIRPPQVDLSVSTHEINNKIDDNKYTLQNQDKTFQNNLAEFRINQYEIAVEHLQNRLEANVTKLKKIEERHARDIEYYKEEINVRNRKIEQLENENRALVESLSQRIVKVEESEQNEWEEKILGY